VFPSILLVRLSLQGIRGFSGGLIYENLFSKIDNFEAQKCLLALLRPFRFVQLIIKVNVCVYIGLSLSQSLLIGNFKIEKYYSQLKLTIS